VTTLRSGSATDVGRVRTTNQDVALEDPDLFAVADGMGGHVGGEVAARVAVDSLRAAFQRQPTVEGLRSAVAEANRAVWRQGQSETGLRGMGTTLTATALVEETGGKQVIALANVGDSRAYVFSNRQVIQVTADHSLAEEKVRQGQLTEAEAAVHPHRHILTRALGVSSDVDVDLWELHLHDGDRILLCSDGLTNEIGDERIGQLLATVKDPSEAAKALVKAALDHGGSDNVTCIVIDVVGVESIPAPAAAALTGTAPGEGSDGDEGTGAGASGSSGSGDVSDGGGTDVATRTLRAVGGNGTSARETSRAGASAATASRSRTTSILGTRDRGPSGNGGGKGGDDEGSATGAGNGGGAGARAPGVLSAARLQAAELRRLRPTQDDRRYRRRSGGAPRILTFRLVLFVILLLGVVAAAVYLVRWYAMDDWYVAIDHGHLAVYQGRPGGFLWFKPQLVDDTPVTTSEVLPYRLPALRRDPQKPSLRAAKTYVTNLHNEYLATKSLSNGGTPSVSSGGSSSSANSGGSTSTTAGAFAPPMAAWQ
jgi:serine/threonine protein phosphatase PrpC